MSTKTVQTQQNQYDPTAMSTYQGMQSGLGSAIGGYMNNPFSNPFFQTQAQMGTSQANAMGQSGMNNLTRNLTASGIQQNSPAALQMMQQQSMGNSANRANLGFLNPMQNAFTAQQNAMGLASQYRPLQTGGTQTQQKSGLGTWLPQVAGMGLSALTGGLGGMMGAGMGAASGAMSGTMGAMSAAMSPMQGGQGSYYGPSGGMGMGAPDVGGYNFGQSPFMMGQPQGY
jgi:hypothetical protein